MVTLLLPEADRSPSRRVVAGFNILVFMVAAAVAVTHLVQVGEAAAAYPAFWIMAGLALVAGTQAFVAAAPPGDIPLIICPTICFSFAILLCFGLGPAVVTQLAAVAVVTWRLRRPVREAFVPAAQYTLSLAAASVVLWLGNPDPFERDGSTNLVTDAVAVVGSVAAWLVTYGLLAYAVARLRGGRPRQVRDLVGNQVLFNAALLLLSPVLAVAGHINIGFVPLVFVPLYAVQRMAKLSAERDRAARIDPLTGLSNRSGLKASFDDIVTSGGGRGPGGRAVLLMLDLDRFKNVNDALGHDVGDQLLTAVSRRLAQLQPAGGTVSRLGGDEFAIMTTADSVAEAYRIANQVVDTLAEPVSLDGLRVDVTASVGIAIHNGGDFATLMRHADIAMYDAKQRGSTTAVYQDGSDDHNTERLRLLTDFRHALLGDDRDEITMHYQPQASLVDGTVSSVEALLRWRHPRHGLINTQELLAVAEHSSVMQLLTKRVIDDAVAQVAAWNADGIRLRASINISARDLYGDDIVSHLSTRLRRHRVDPAQIQVEITESALLCDPGRAMATVARIAALGVPVALDDFGTGYSSLQHLRKLAISEIKIDRSFVAGMADNRDDAAIVRSTIEMARSLGIRTVAEGVEIEYTRQLLADAGCDLAQGWLTARAMPAGEIAGWLAAHAPRRPAVTGRPHSVRRRASVRLTGSAPGRWRYAELPDGWSDRSGPAGRAMLSAPSPRAPASQPA